MSIFTVDESNILEKGKVSDDMTIGEDLSSSERKSNDTVDMSKQIKEHILGTEVRNS